MALLSGETVLSGAGSGGLLARRGVARAEPRGLPGALWRAAARRIGPPAVPQGGGEARQGAPGLLVRTLLSGDSSAVSGYQFLVTKSLDAFQVDYGRS